MEEDTFSKNRVKLPSEDPPPVPPGPTLTSEVQKSRKNLERGQKGSFPYWDANLPTAPRPFHTWKQPAIYGRKLSEAVTSRCRKAAIRTLS